MSAFAAQGQAGLIMGWLWNPMFAMAVVTFVLVIGALAWALFRRRAADEASLEPGRQRSLARVVRSCPSACGEGSVG